MVGDEVVISGRYDRVKEARAPSPGGGGRARVGFAGHGPVLGLGVGANRGFRKSRRSALGGGNKSDREQVAGACMCHWPVGGAWWGALLGLKTTR